MKPQWQNDRGIKERIQIKGRLVLETPTHPGSGETGGPLDMPLMRDPVNGNILLTGTSIAGALRNYVSSHNSSDDEKDLASLLFGDADQDQSEGSLVIVDDAVLFPDQSSVSLEIRDGVRISPETRAAEEKKKYDMEFISAGTAFELRFELLVPQQNSKQIKEVFALALQGLEQGEIHLGKRKSRGFGQCRVTKWWVKKYDLTTPAGMVEWLKNDLAIFNNDGKKTGLHEGQPSMISGELGVDLANYEHQANWCSLEGTFALSTSLLIRSASNQKDGPDTVHLKSKRVGESTPVAILSGTSLAGALRARTEKIGNTLGKNGSALADHLFGMLPKSNGGLVKMTASRVFVEEAEVAGPRELVQTRIRIDRFTGGSYEGALFSEQALYQQDSSTKVKIKIKLREPQKKEIGLLLLLLKDLWTEDLPLGGESGIGRGRLRGESASLFYQGETWRFKKTDLDGGVKWEGPEEPGLQELVNAFVEADDE